MVTYHRKNSDFIKNVFFARKMEVLHEIPNMLLSFSLYWYFTGTFLTVSCSHYNRLVLLFAVLLGFHLNSSILKKYTR